MCNIYLQPVAVASTNQERGVIFAEKYGFRKVYLTYEELEKDEEIGKLEQESVSVIKEGQNSSTYCPISTVPVNNCDFRENYICHSHFRLRSVTLTFMLTIFKVR